MKRASAWSSELLASLSGHLTAQEGSTPFDSPVLVFDETESVLCLADLDGDGDADGLGFWGITTTSTAVHAFANDGSGRFAPAWEFVDPAGQADRAHWSMEVGRFDADARDDFALRLGSRFTVYRSNGLAAPSVLATWIEPLATGGGAMVVADFDRDGRTDIAADLGGVVHLYRNAGVGFALTGSVAVACDELDAIDADGDGDLDLVAGRRADAQILLQQQGVLQLGAVLAHGVGQGTDPVFTVAGDIDLDGDGDLDVVANTRGVTVLHNDGGRSYRVSAVSTGLDVIGRELLAVVDADADGALDLIVGPTRGPTFVFLRGRGDATFEPPVVQLGLGGTAVADVDGDGDADLLSGELVRNATFGAGAGSIEQYGTGGAGSGGFAPVLGASGPFRVGANVTTMVRGAYGGTIGAWLWSLQRSDLPDFPLPGIHHYTWPVVLGVTMPFSGAAGAAGAGELEAAYTVPASAAGVTLYQQFHLLDPAMPAGVGYTNGIEIRYGQ